MLVGTAQEVSAIAPERQDGENLLDYAERVAKVKEIDDARKQVASSPTDAQKEAGNYKKGHITLDGYDLTIENPKGSTRSGVDANGQPWSVTMNNDYGYIRGTQGVDGDHIDVFLSDDPTTGKVYVIDQVKEDGSFDEHKVMYGFSTAVEARDAYLANYSPDWKGLGTISEVSKEEFRKWVDSSHRKTKPFAEYRSVKVEGAQNEPRPAISQEMDANGRPFVLASDGTSTFGNITEETGLTAAPIKLSEGFQSEDGKGYGLAHIEYRHGEQIRNAGFPSIETFVEEVAKHFTVIKRGNARGVNETYLLEVQDAHNNTLFVELSQDGSYWNVNSAGVFKKGYSKKKDIVWTVPALGSSTNADATEVYHGQSKGETVTSGDSSQTISSEGKDSNKSEVSQTSDKKTGEERQPHLLPGRLLKAYESGDAALIAPVEQDMRNFVNAAKDMRSVYVTYLRSKDLERSMEKGSPSNKTQHFIAEACKDALKKAGLPVKAMQSERARTEIAGSITDARLLDIMSADFSFDVIWAIIKNPHTSNATLERFTKVYSNNGLDYDAQQELEKRKNAQNSQTASEHLPDAGKMTREQEEAEKIQQQSGPVEKIEDVGEKIGGAKKDRFKEFVEKEKQLQEKPDSFMEELRKLPVSKIFNFNLEALRKDGLSNEAATLIDVIRRVIPSKPRTDWKLKRWVSDVFGLYRFCLTLATAEQGTFDSILERVTNIKQIGGMYRAQMALGGFDSGLDTGQATLEELGDSAGHYDKDDNWVSLKGQWYVAHAGRYGGIYPDYEKAKEALAQFAGENSKGKEKGTEVKFSVYSYKNSGEAFITPKGKPNIVVESGFKSSKEAMDYLNEHMDELQAKYRNMKDSTSIGFAPNSERRGKDWRGGKDVTAEDFRNTFGFRGVEFGNWANQQERQRALNQAYDAFMDLSEATGISPRGLSLGGELGMAFGARGGGGAAAHYEPGKVVINLTKTQGAGTLAHEWWHAIDNYFSRRRGQALGYNTERKGYNLPVRGGKVEREHEAERKEITNAFTALMKAINGSSYGERSNAYASLKSSYWKEPTELGARAFAVWVERKLSEKGIVNNFLANNNTIGWESPELTQKYYPYPLESDFESLDTAFDNLFGAIEEKVDEETGNTVLYRNGAGFLSDDVLSATNDPVSKLLGQSTRTANQRRAFAERERRNMAARVQELAGKLHLDNVEIVDEPMAITDRKGKTHYPKGFYNRATDKIVIVIPNNSSTFDAEQTLLHEAVAHYGLRRLFGEHFDTFLDNVFNNADVEVRRKIVALAQKNGWDTRLATEEYLASLAEDTNFDDLSAGWWRKIKELFLRMLHKIGFEGFDGVTLSDNELRYILWRSYENLLEPGRYRSILGQAEDIAKQYELKVGNYAPTDASVGQVADENLLFRETPDGNTADDGTREAYNRAVSGNRFKAQEAYQDSMLALKRLQEVIEQRTEKLKSFENAYMAENQMSSKSTREAEVYGEKYFKPMLEAVGKLIEQGTSYGEIIDYMVAKHGLERNEVFAERDARQEADRRYEKLYQELERLYDLGGITEDEYEERKDGLNAAKEDYYQNRLAQHLDEDYSGLTALAEKYDALEEGFEAHAKELVRDFEVKFDIDDLWTKVNAATKETLRKSYESGMMSRDTYNKVKGQFKHYIPLRGWDEQTAEDVYEYLNSETSPVNSVLKAAKGRRSMADDPLATIGNMAESTILQGNRNLMKQAFLNMAINHPTDVLTLKEAWYVLDPSTGEWTLSFPDIQEGDDAETISSKVEEHEQRMRELKADGQATQVKEGLNINYRIGTRQAQEHIVTVKRNGRDYLVYVNGNPRAAQAVNGLTNPTVESNKLLAGIARFNRELAANFTNRNPAFVLSNLSRDLIFSVSAVAIKENPRYAARFAKNIPRAMRVIFRNLRGKGSMTNADDRLFEEFLSNGGETGYTSLHSVDEYKKLVRRSIGKYAGKRDYFAAVRSAAGFFSLMNRWAEDVSRFTTYMTSKEEGRSVTEAVNDAKEVTVNFNRRGAATKTEGVFGWTSGLFRNLYLFFNAAVQSLTNFARLAKKNRKGFLTALGGFTAAGFLVPWLNTLAISMLGGDDDDYYGNLPDWVRRNNLCLYAGNGKFITIPLPIELRAFYGLGEMAYQATVRQDYDKDQIAYQAVNQITELLPINPLGNNGDLVTTMMPDVLSPFWQIYENKDFTGKPIYRENAFNKTMPEWTKAYNSTLDWLVDLSRWTNELAGGDDYKQAGVMEPLMNWNPAKVEHLFESYFGGMAKTFNQTIKTLIGGVKSAMEGEWSDDLQLYSTPVLNRFINDAADDRSAYSKLNQRYYKLYDLYDEVQKLNRGYANEVTRGNMDYLDKLVRLQQSRDFKVYQLFRHSKRAIDRIRDIEKHLPEEGSEQRRKELQEETNRLKRQLLERVDELE